MSGGQILTDSLLQGGQGDIVRRLTGDARRRKYLAEKLEGSDIWGSLPVVIVRCWRAIELTVKLGLITEMSILERLHH